MTEDSFGFSAARKSTADKLKSIKPSPSHPAPAMERVDRAGEALGFRSREPEPPPAPAPLRRRREIGPTVAINTRAPERVAGPFIRFCEENRYSYWEGIEELMKRAGIG